MGIPGWAIPLGVALKGPEVVGDVFGLYKSIRDDMRAQSDTDQYAKDLAQFQADPAYQPDYAKYGDRLKAETTLSPFLKERRELKYKESAPSILEKLTKNDGMIQAEDGPQSVLPGAVISDKEMSNPYVRKGVADFTQKRRTISDLTDTFAGTAGPGTLARLAVADKLDNLPTVQSGFQERNKIIEEYRTGEETKSAAAEYEKLMAKPDLSPFERISGIAGIVKKYPRVTKNFLPDMTSNLNAQRELGQVTPTGPVEPYTVGVGRSQESGTLQRFQLGPPKVVATTTSVAPAPRITINQGNRDRTAEFNLRKEFLGLPEVKEFPTIETNTRRAAAALKETGSKLAVDQSLITVFNKMIDPASVVRESEYARTPQDMAVLSRIKGKWSKIQEGGAGLDVNERLALARMITNFSTIASKQYNARAAEYRQLAKEYGFEPGRVVARRNDLDESQAPDLKAAAAAELARRKGRK